MGRHVRDAEDETLPEPFSTMAGKAAKKMGDKSLPLSRKSYSRQRVQ